MFLVAILIVPILASSVSFSTVHAQSNGTNNNSGLPYGAPSPTALSSSGNQLALLVEQSPQFKNLAGGKPFSIDPYSSFGYTWGPGIVPTVRIIFFSPDRVSYVVAEVANSTRSIQQIYLVNDTSPKMVFAQSANWGGYSAQDCAGSTFGWCWSAWALYKAYGNIQFPNSLTLPHGANPNACCSFAEWTGTGQNSQGSNMVQGGAAWAGMDIPTLPAANANGYSLWTEDIYDSRPPVFFTPPGWMNGVAGQTITETTVDYTVCSFNPIKDQWAQSWTLGGSSTLQYIACLPHNSQTWAYYILEAPALPACSPGGYTGYICQIPHFSSNNCNNCVSFTGIICDQNGPGTCINLNTNANPLTNWYIQQNAQDTTTSNIAPNGNQWFETWINSA